MKILRNVFLPFPNQHVPGSKTHSANTVLIVLFIVILIIFGIGGYHMRLGLHPLFKSGIAIACGFLFYAIALFILKGIYQLTKSIPSSIIISLLGLILLSLFLNLLIFPWPSNIFFLFLLILFLFIIILVFSVIRLRQKFNIWYLSGIGIPIVLIVFGLIWILKEGSKEQLKYEFTEIENGGTLSDLGIKSPSEVGNFQVKEFTYGSGTDQQRSEYGDSIDIKTKTVDATRLLPEWKGKKKKWREKYWGFGPDSFPVNGRVSMPIGDGPFPIVMIVHGNHSMADYSDGGYEYLLAHLASRGFISVSVDENFLNGHWSGDFRGREMPTRGWVLLKHLEQWREWNLDQSSEFYNKVDLEKVILIGHSRGGEAVSIAAKFNELTSFPDNALENFGFNFGIKGIVTIAPTDYRYNRQIFLKNIDYLSIQGTYDSDESSFWGFRPYNRLIFDDNEEHFKAAVLIHGANHGQFNTTWNRSDMGAPFKWLFNIKPIISRSDQEEAAKIFITSFVETSINNNSSYIPLFQNPDLGLDWLPKNYYVSNYQSSTFRKLSDFEEDIDPTTTSSNGQINTENLKIWKEEILETRDNGSQENSAVLLGWDYGEKDPKDSSAIYRLLLNGKDSTQTIDIHTLSFSLAKGKLSLLKDRKEIIPDTLDTDANIVLKDAFGNTVTTNISAHKKITPRLFIKFGKTKQLSERFGSSWEPQLESFHIPISKFTGDERFDISSLIEIQFIFDVNPYGVIYLDDIGYN